MRRFAICCRIKLGLKNQEDAGGYGNQQSYFEGAVAILNKFSTQQKLKQTQKIQLPILLSGKISLQDYFRVSRVARRYITFVINTFNFLMPYFN